MAELTQEADRMWQKAIKDTSRPVRTLNENFGDPVSFASLAEMYDALNKMDYVPEDGLQEGRDYEYILPTSARLYMAERGINARAFQSMEDAKTYFLKDWDEPIADDDDIAVNVYVTPSGAHYYEVVPYSCGTNCSWASLDDIEDWWQEEWTEKVTEPYWHDAEEDFWLSWED